MDDVDCRSTAGMSTRCNGFRGARPSPTAPSPPPSWATGVWVSLVLGQHPLLLFADHLVEVIRLRASVVGGELECQLVHLVERDIVAFDRGVRREPSPSARAAIVCSACSTGPCSCSGSSRFRLFCSSSSISGGPPLSRRSSSGPS